MRYPQKKWPLVFNLTDIKFKKDLWYLAVPGNLESQWIPVLPIQDVHVLSLPHWKFVDEGSARLLKIFIVTLTWSSRYIHSYFHCNNLFSWTLLWSVGLGTAGWFLPQSKSELPETWGFCVSDREVVVVVVVEVVVVVVEVVDVVVLGQFGISQ